jgi:hypothetical protein
MWLAQGSSFDAIGKHNIFRDEFLVVSLSTLSPSSITNATKLWQIMLKHSKNVPKTQNSNTHELSAAAVILVCLLPFF